MINLLLSIDEQVKYLNNEMETYKKALSDIVKFSNGDFCIFLISNDYTKFSEILFKNRNIKMDDKYLVETICTKILENDKMLQLIQDSLNNILEKIHSYKFKNLLSSTT